MPRSILIMPNLESKRPLGLGIINLVIIMQDRVLHNTELMGAKQDYVVHREMLLQILVLAITKRGILLVE